MRTQRLPPPRSVSLMAAMQNVSIPRGCEQGVESDPRRRGEARGKVIAVAAGLHRRATRGPVETHRGLQAFLRHAAVSPSAEMRCHLAPCPRCEKRDVATFLRSFSRKEERAGSELRPLDWSDLVE